MKFLPSLSYRLGILLVISAVFAGCVNKAQPSFERPPAPVVVSTAVSQDVSNYMDALGKIVARETVAIQPQVSGRIEKIHFADGANVKRGQLLFTLDPRPFDANVKQAQANLAKDTAAKKQAEANLAREVARENWGRAQVERYRTLAVSIAARSTFNVSSALRTAARSTQRRSNSVTATSIRQSTAAPGNDW
jgi:multidrug efflux system membrane fusion protein